MPAITLPKDQTFRYLVEPTAGWCIKSIHISFVEGQEGTRIQPDSFAKHEIVIEPDGTEREVWIKVRLTSWDNIIAGTGGGGGNDYLPLAGSSYDVNGNPVDAMTGENIFFTTYAMEISNTKTENNNSIYSGFVLRPNESKDDLDIFLYSSKNQVALSTGTHVLLNDDKIILSGLKRLFSFNGTSFVYGENIFKGLQYSPSLLNDDVSGRLHQRWDAMTETERGSYIPTIAYVKKMIEEGGGGQTITILSHSLSAALIVGQTVRLTVITSTNANSTATNVVTVSNATVVEVSSIAGQWVADITPTAAGAVNITAFNNNGMNATNLPYNIGTSTVQLYKGDWDGINDEVTYSNAINAAIAAATNWTMEGWVKFDTLPNDNSWMPVCGSYNSAGSRTGIALAYDRRPYLGSNPNFYLGMSSSTNVFYDYFRTELTAGVDYHVAYVKESNQLRFYLNGNLSGTATINYTILNSPELFKLGNAGNLEPSDYGGSRFDGQIYDFSISDVARYSANFTPSRPINNADTLLLFEPISKTDNVVDNTAIGGATIGNGTLLGVNPPYTDFYKLR